MADTKNNYLGYNFDKFSDNKENGVTTKYLNYAGLVDFWANVKDYIDFQDLCRSGQNIPLYPRGTENNISITAAIEDLSNAINNASQSDWNETDESSAAFIKNKTHGETLIDVRTIGSYTHTNDITYIRHDNVTFKLELGVKTQIHSGPPAWVTLTSSNTILIEEASPGWISAYPVFIIDIQKIDVKYLPDEVLNVNVNVSQSDWNESFSSSPSYINNRTHYIEYVTLNGSNQFELSNYTELTPYIVNYNGSVYTLVEGENQLSWGPPMKVILNGTQLTIDESSYIDDTYPLKIAVHIEKLNPIYLNTITLDMLDDVWEDVIGHEDAVLDTGTLNTRKLG